MRIQDTNRLITPTVNHQIELPSNFTWKIIKHFPVARQSNQYQTIVAESTVLIKTWEFL